MGLILRKDLITQIKSKEILNTMMAINAIPGIHILSNNLGHRYNMIKKNWGKIHIFIHSEEGYTDGLFFLSRCVDRRYWEHGSSWKITIQVGDELHVNGDRPIVYVLERELNDSDNEDLILLEFESMYDNIQEHFWNDNFISGYNINREDFHIVDEIAWERDKKLEKIL